jgi:hypothetical protein
MKLPTVQYYMAAACLVGPKPFGDEVAMKFHQAEVERIARYLYSLEELNIRIPIKEEKE